MSTPTIFSGATLLRLAAVLFSTGLCSYRNRSSLHIIDNGVSRPVTSIRERDYMMLHPSSSPTVFEDMICSSLAAFINNPGLVEVIDRYFGETRPAAAALRNQVYEIVGMRLYNYCVTHSLELEVTGTPVGNTLAELTALLNAEGLTRIELPGRRFNFTPGKAFKFLNDDCGLEYLDVSMTGVNVVELNAVHLDKIKQLNISFNRLRAFPDLSNFTRLVSVDLTGNGIGRVTCARYLTEEPGRFKTLPNLKFVKLQNNPIADVEFGMRCVFPGHTILSLDGLAVACVGGEMRVIFPNDMARLIYAPDDAEDAEHGEAPENAEQHTSN